MKIKLFTFASIIFILLVFALCFYKNLGNYTLELGSFSYELPVMVWVVAPAVALFIFAFLHMSFYGLLSYMRFKHFFKDGANFETFIQDLLLEKESRIYFQTKEFRDAAALAKTLKDKKKTEDSAKINEILDLIDGLNKGEFLNLSKFKLEPNNPLYLLNEKNHLKSDLNHAYNRVKNLSELKNEFDELAFDCVLKKGTAEQLKNIKIPKTSAQITALVKRVKEGGLELSATEFETLLSGANFNEKEYLSAAKSSVKLFNPDAILGIFGKLKNEQSEAVRAYLYILVEFAMFDELAAQVAQDEEQFNDFKIILALREKGMQFDLNQLIQ